MLFFIKSMACFVLLLCQPLLTGCGEKQQESQPEVRPVQYTRVQRETGLRLQTFSGTAKAPFEKTLSFKVAGTVNRRFVDVGDLVKSGQSLARLDPRDYQVAVREAEADLSAAEAELRNAEANFERILALYENQNASKSDLDAARAAAESASAQVGAAGERLKASRLQLSYAELVSPQDCSIAETYVDENENVAVGQPVVRVNCGECAEIVVSVAETYINLIKTGQQVMVRSEAFGGEGYPATVTEVGVATAQEGATFPVKVRLSGSCPLLLSGMAADVQFSFPSEVAEGLIVVPLVSVGEDRDGRYVFVIEQSDDEHWVARRRPVVLGSGSQRGLVIAEGLKEGELIATAGVRRLQDGVLVTLLESEPER